MKKYLLAITTLLLIILLSLALKKSDTLFKAFKDPMHTLQLLRFKADNWIVSSCLRVLYSKNETYISMRDSVRLFTSIYSPANKSESYPILIWRTPYNVEPVKDEYSYLLRRMEHLYEEKFIFVFQDVRGRYMSEGRFMDVRPYNPNKKGNEADENSDTFDTIEWLLENVPNHNGKVGIFGISYPGFYAAIALPNAHPAVAAISPQAPIADWYLGDDWHHNGAFFLLDAVSFFSNFGQPRPKPTRNFPVPFDFKSENNYEFFKAIGPIKNIEKNYFGDSIQFWNELMTHPNYDDFWKERNYLPFLTTIKPAVLVVGGWFDPENLYGSLKLYESIENLNPGKNKNRLIMGPWYHTQWAWDQGEFFGNINFGSNTSEYFREQELQFFNYYLKNKGEMKLPEASIFITGANEWKEFNSWPLIDNLEQMDLYLNCKQKLSLSAPLYDSCSTEYIVDPNNPVPYSDGIHFYRKKEYMIEDQGFISHRTDVIEYQTDILEQNITAIGSIKVNLYVSTTGTDADYVVKIIDVFPDQIDKSTDNREKHDLSGYKMLVRGDVLRGKYRNSIEVPEPIESNKLVEISFDLIDIAHQYKKGHRIMVQIQNSWFPLVDLNPQKFVNIYNAREEDFIKATHRIYHGAKYPSKITFNTMAD